VTRSTATRSNTLSRKHATQARKTAPRRAGQKIYQPAEDLQQVVAPFDGVVTQRNIDLGS